ncbi:MAG TPA: CsgG/HfaB family protein [Blastocatellia bacterium]
MVTKLTGAAVMIALVAVIAGPVYAQRNTVKRKPKIAVLTFDDGELGSLANGIAGQKVANYTIDKMVKSGVYTVVEREVIDKILREQNFGVSGRVDGNTAAQIGKISGADVILYGNVSKYKFEIPFNLNPFKKKGRAVVELTARLADAKTVSAAAS